MILICPHCAARSRVHDAQAQQAMAQVQCKGCDKRYFVAAAHQDMSVAAVGNRPHAPRHRGLLGPLQRAMLALLVPLGFALFALWDLPRLGPLAPALTVQLQTVAEPLPSGLALAGVTAAPYSENGGPEGILLTGEVVNTSGTPLQFVPAVAVRATHQDAPDYFLGHMPVGSRQTLKDADSLAPMAQDTRPKTQEIGAKSALPFVGLVTLPEHFGPTPWAVHLTWPTASGAQ